MNFDFETLPHHWINRLGFLIRRELQDEFHAAGLDISAEEWAVLLFLWRQDGLNPGELAAFTVRDPTTMTRMLDSMSRKNLVARQIDPVDRRKYRVCLTPYAKEIRPKLVACAQALIARSVVDVDPGDLAVTVKVLKTLTENILNKADGDA